MGTLFSFRLVNAKLSACAARWVLRVPMHVGAMGYGLHWCGPWYVVWSGGGAGKLVVGVVVTDDGRTDEGGQKKEDAETRLSRL